MSQTWNQQPQLNFPNGVDEILYIDKSDNDIQKRAILSSLPISSSLSAGEMFLGNESNITGVFPTGLDPKADCRAATTANITLEDSQTIDGVDVVNPDRVLVKDQTDATENGIYVVTDLGAWNRAGDVPTGVIDGVFTLVTEGTLFANTIWSITNPDPIDINTTALRINELNFSSLANLNNIQTFTAENTFGANTLFAARSEWSKGTDAASASQVILTNTGNTFDITGNTTINEIDATNWQSGSVIHLQFDGAVQIINDAAVTNPILLANGATFTTAAGDVLSLYFDDIDDKWHEISRSPIVTGGATTLNELTDVTITTQATGDILYADSGSSWVNLASATDGQVLTLASGIPSWATSATLSNGEIFIGNFNGTLNQDYPAGIDTKENCLLASTANIDLATGTLLTIDTVTTVAGNRVLVKNQTNPSENGIYVAAVGTWDRSTDADAPAEINDGMLVFISSGSVNIGKAFLLDIPVETVVIGTTELTFVEFEIGRSSTNTVNTNYVNFFENNTTEQTGTLPDDTNGRPHTTLFKQGFTPTEFTMGGISFTFDGLTMFILRDTNLDNKLFQYDLSFPYDISTAMDSGNEISVEGTNDRGFFFRADGLKFFYGDINQELIRSYTLTTPYDLSTASIDSATLNIDTIQNNVRGVFFHPDGKKLFITGIAPDEITEFTLTTPWDLGTASETNNISLETIDVEPNGLYFSQNGTRVYFAGNENDRYYMVPLPFPWDISTLGPEESFSTNDQFSESRAIFLKPGLSKVFLCSSDISGNAIFEYDIGIATEGHFSTSGIVDTNGNELILFPSPVTNAVNEITISNAATNDPVLIEATGGDTNIDVKFLPQGTGTFYGNRETFAWPLQDVSADASVLIASGITPKFTTEPAPYNMTIEDAIGGLTTAGTGATLVTLDIRKEDGVSTGTFGTIFSTLITLDATETTSTTATTPPVISNNIWEKGRRLELFVTVVDTDAGGAVAAGAKLELITHATDK